METDTTGTLRTQKPCAVAKLCPNGERCSSETETGTPTSRGGGEHREKNYPRLWISSSAVLFTCFFISMLEPSTWRIVKSGEEGREARRSRKGGYACSCNHTNSPRGVQGHLSIEYFVGLVIKRGARRGCQM
jgi:hypothetical protein